MDRKLDLKADFEQVIGFFAASVVSKSKTGLND